MNLRHLYTAVAILILNMLTLASSAQRNYPVRATVQYTPPYSLFLGDYATPKLIITLTGQDLLDANCPYKLSFSLECQNVKVTTKTSYTPTPLYINGGQTIVLTGADLARYFDIQNLDFHGITAAKYLQDGQLPEGFYRMNVKVIHYHENRVISNTAFTMFNARMGKPPVLTLPKDKSLIPPNQQVMPIVFSWTPKTVGSYQYRFELWECAVPGIPVQTVVSTIRPIYTQTTFSPMLTLHTANLNMKPGMEYAWRITVEDPHNQQKFANQGQSEIFTFTYKRKPEPVTGLRFSNRGLKITWTWDMDPAHTKYYFEYYDPQTGRTIDPVACDYAEFVRNMPQTGYHLKVRVRAECYGDPTLLSDYTPYLDTYLEPIPVPEYECGKQFPDREITNLELKHSFAPGEIVESKNGDTRYEIIFSEENNGYLSGQFFMIMDCWGGAKIRCEFSKTQINTDNIVLKTIFHNVPDSTLYVKPETIRKEVEQAFFDAATVLTDFSIKDTVKLDKPYTYLYVNPSGKVMAVIDDKGKIKTEETTISATNLKENTLVQGKNGEELVITKKGQVMGKNEFNATGGNPVLLKDYHRKSDSLAQWQINFSKYDGQTYAFDHIGSGNHGIFSGADYYPQVGSYDFRYKSVECGKSDKVRVEFDTYTEKDSVLFKDKYGVTYPIKDRILTFTGVSKADTNYIYAYRGDKKIGKLFLNTYQKKTYKVVFVRVNGAAKKMNVDKVKEDLNKVYKQCAVKFEISTEDFSLPELTSFSHGGSGILTVYNDDQKRVLEAYEKTNKMKDGVYYLFFIDGVTDKKDGSGTPVSGYMPRGYNAGFIYDGGSERTIAHELGHGIAGLEHVFENSNASGKTANLMDYANGEELWHFQWDQIQDPSRVWMKWNKAEEEGENVEGGEKLNPLISFKIKGNKTKEYEYENGGLFATMYTEDEITIEIQNKGDKDLEIEEIKWENGSKKGKSDEHIDKDNKQVVLKLNQKNLGNIGEKSKLSVLDKSGQIIAFLDFQTYYPPYIEFSVNDKTYNGEFLFDDSFNHISKVSLDNPTEYFKQYVHINVGNKNIDYCAPVLGLQQHQSADILLNFKEFDDLAKQDKNFKIVITSDNPSIKINKDPSFEINSSNIELYKNGAITIQFTETLQSRENNKLPQNGVLLYAEVPSLNKKIGLIECYCTEMIKKQIDLISVRFDSKSSFPKVNVSELKKYLNEHAFNQLFIDLDISLFEWDLDKDLYLNNPVYLRLDDKEKKKFKEEYCLTENSFVTMEDGDVYNKLSEFHNPFSEFLGSLTKLNPKDATWINKIGSLQKESFKYNQKQTENGSGELFFLTKIQKIQGANRYVGGFHSTGENGGALYTTTESFDKRYDQFAHEFGHWVGLPHAFRKQPDKSEEEKSSTAVAFIVKLMKDTKNNYMDYDITRKSWTKLQLINVK